MDCSRWASMLGAGYVPCEDRKSRTRPGLLSRDRVQAPVMTVSPAGPLPGLPLLLRRGDIGRLGGLPVGGSEGAEELSGQRVGGGQFGSQGRSTAGRQARSARIRSARTSRIRAELPHHPPARAPPWRPRSPPAAGGRDRRGRPAPGRAHHAGSPRRSSAHPLAKPDGERTNIGRFAADALERAGWWP